MKYVTIPVTPFQQNCTILWCEETMKGAAVDPGGNVERILAGVRAHGVTLEKLLLTHGHLDHVGGTGDLATQLNLPIEGPHQADDYWIGALDQQSRMFGLDQVRPFTPTRWLADGDTVTVGNLSLDVIHCPGHTPGHVAFYHAPSRLVLVGDVLFHGSIGRTDLPGGDYSTLMRSIREKLLPLGDDVTFLPGHGPESTLGVERRTNGFLVR